MKTRVWDYLLPLLFLISGTAAIAQEQNDASVPGDNFSLEGALDLFKKSSSPEEFEKLLNSSDSKVNNLDLNGDGKTDYIRIVDKNEGNVHAFIIQSVISENESQDVAVIELEKLADGKARLQIIGDEDVYGQETIIEPTQDVRVNAGTSTARSTVNVWAWPSVQYVYGPYYNPWVSPWGWAYYPGWWSPWNPVAYAVYNPWWTPYRAYYSPCYSYRIGYAQRMYRPYRTTSVIVYNRHSAQINNYRSNNNNYSHNGRGRYDRSSSDGNRNGNRYSSNNNSGRTTYYDKNHSSNRSSWSGRNDNSNNSNNNRSSWSRSNNTGRSDNNNQGGRTSNNFSNGSRDNNSNFSNQQRSSWGNRANSGSLNSGSYNNWQRSSSGSSMGRGSSSGSGGFSRSQSSGGGGSFQRSAPSGGGSSGGGSHSGGGSSRGRH